MPILQVASRSANLTHSDDRPGARLGLGAAVCFARSEMRVMRASAASRATGRLAAGDCAGLCCAKTPRLV